jgi:hypothetical protein
MGESAHIYAGLFGQNVVGSETYVTVSNVYIEIDALPLAEEHCQKNTAVVHTSITWPSAFTVGAIGHILDRRGRWGWK